MKFIATLFLILGLTACVSTHDKPVHFNVHHNCFDSIMTGYEVDTQRMWDGINLAAMRAMKAHNVPISESTAKQLAEVCIALPEASFDEAAEALKQQKFSSTLAAVYLNTNANDDVYMPELRLVA